jgi:transmembrane sensor
LTQMTDSIAQAALDWQLRQDEMDAADWQCFVAWLEANPRHAEAYDRLVMADALLRDAAPALSALAPAPLQPSLSTIPANDPGHAGWRWSRWIAGAAACAAAMGALLILRPPAPDIYTVETQPGETRQVQLDEGSRVEIAGGSRLIFDRNQPRLVTLERGDALFHVRHDEARPFVVRSGALEVHDVGTVFNVSRDGPAFAVSVAEGIVLFQPDKEAVTLTAGKALTVREDEHAVHVSQLDPALVGGWRNGRLAFTDTPVAQALRTIERHYGLKITVDDGLSSRALTGIITLSGEAQRDVPHIASMIGANWRAEGERWILSPMEDRHP